MNARQDRVDAIPESQIEFSNLAIVGGCGSSGTTLLAHLVSRHPDIASGPEFNYFNHLDLYDIDSLRHVLPALLSGRGRPSGYIDVRSS